MTPKDAIALAKRARKLLRAGQITAKQFVLLDCLLWCCRSRTGSIVVSYTALQRLCHIARATVADGLRALERLGVLSRVKHRIRVGWRSLQATSSYVLHPPGRTEFSGQPVLHNESIQIREPSSEVLEARAVLAAVRERRRPVIEARLLLNRGGIAVPAT
jgi:hypothetical protein